MTEGKSEDKRISVRQTIDWVRGEEKGDFFYHEKVKRLRRKVGTESEKW